VPANGNTAAAPTALVRTGGTTAYTTSAGTCDVAPAGGVYCSLPIGTPPGGGAVYLHGMLDAAGGSGQGQFAIGAAPAIQSTGPDGDALSATATAAVHSGAWQTASTLWPSRSKTNAP
jgi:hypothetical protein